MFPFIFPFRRRRLSIATENTVHEFYWISYEIIVQIENSSKMIVSSVEKQLNNFHCENFFEMAPKP